nr:hypothetical protein [Tanacetum cinerariifolium]
MFLCLNMWAKMALQDSPHVSDYPSEVKSMKYENFIRNYGWAEPHLHCILEEKERANQPPNSNGFWYTIEKRPHCKSGFIVVTGKGLLGWHSNWVWVDVSKTRLPYECIRWRSIVNLDSKAQFPL